MMSDPYLDQALCVQRLIDNYREHNTLLVAFDFDNTIYDFHDMQAVYPVVVSLLRQAAAQGMTLMLFTSRSGDDLQKAVDYCRALSIDVKWVNTSPVNPGHVKPYYNILLDDRAGLRESCDILLATLAHIRRL